jgi:hypothetical protein
VELQPLVARAARRLLFLAAPLSLLASEVDADGALAAAELPLEVVLLLVVPALLVLSFFIASAA